MPPTATIAVNKRPSAINANPSALARRDTDWPDTLDEYVSRFVKKYPSQENEIRYFLRESDAPEDEAKKFTANLKTFMGWLTEASGHHR